MARPLSEEKRSALLAAAIDAVGSSGVAASTLKIAKDAGVAEGTPFRYFPTKDDLFNQLYLRRQIGDRSNVGSESITLHSYLLFCTLWHTPMRFPRVKPVYLLPRLRVSRRLLLLGLMAEQDRQSV